MARRRGSPGPGSVRLHAPGGSPAAEDYRDAAPPAGSIGAPKAAADGGPADSLLVAKAVYFPVRIPPPSKGVLVFLATLTVGAIHPVGKTPYGHRRHLDITGGRLKGSVLTGKLDLDLTLSNSTVEIEQINVLRASDGASIYVRGLGVTPAGDPAARVVLDFEAPTDGAHAWLNCGTYAAVRRLRVNPAKALINAVRPFYPIPGFQEAGRFSCLGTNIGPRHHDIWCCRIPSARISFQGLGSGYLCFVNCRPAPSAWLQIQAVLRFHQVYREET